ncbi:hypothetical protein [Sulfitobacter dubius]|uniref:hypothetical protein n=1 Tax=Sulfitobacter dubius TaxID=218673 RepID=UPI0022AEF035|nr:hypothetical protein [Sulfitobacter dubius]MCZ4366645.1 hypothetical protein [Sulfitobacter dubius]
MTPLSAHRRMQLIALVNRGTQRVRQLDGAIFLFYDGITVNISRWQMRVICPFDPAEAAFLESLGVLERAKEVIENGEGIVDPMVRVLERRKRFEAQVIDFRQRLARASQSE